MYSARVLEVHIEQAFALKQHVCATRRPHVCVSLPPLLFLSLSRDIACRAQFVVYSSLGVVAPAETVGERAASP